jgi:myosin-light-chain kinase
MGCGGSKTPVESAAGTTKTEESKPSDKEASSSSKAPEEPATPAASQEDIRDKYELGKLLGSGSFGQVREAKLKESGEVRAVKMLEPDKGDGEWSNHAMFLREVGLLQQINHENIIRYFDFYEDHHFLYVVMGLCNGGEVFAKIVEIKRFSEKNAAQIGQQMLQAIEYIHSICICHRDIKAENFMLQEASITSNIKMIDFGMATKFKPDQVLTELCGSPHYLSPELIGQKYDCLADIWAFGVLLYLLMYGHYPYDAKHPRDIMVKILTEPIKWVSRAKLSKEAIEFLSKLLEHDFKKRLTAKEALAHPWMTKATIAPDTDSALLCPDAVRSAHKKVTGTKKLVDVKLDQLRTEKLQAIDEDYSKGIRHGQRLGETPKEEYMSKPEFVRRDNKITTAPSHTIVGAKNQLGGIGLSIPAKANMARRLSNIQGITNQDCISFGKLFEDKKQGTLFSTVVPGGGGGSGGTAKSANVAMSIDLPGTSPAKSTNENQIVEAEEEEES